MTRDIPRESRLGTPTQVAGYLALSALPVDGRHTFVWVNKFSLRKTRSRMERLAAEGLSSHPGQGASGAWPPTYVGRPQVAERDAAHRLEKG